MSRNISITKSLLVLLLLNLLLVSCKKDNNGPDTNPPVLTLSTIEATGIPGNNVQSTVTMNAEHGLAKLTIYKNGSLNSEIDYNKENSATYNFTYSIEQNLAAGTVVTFAFEATDTLGVKSEQKSFKVTVGEIINREVIQVNTDITSNTVWTNDKIWRINEIIRVSDGATLTIEPGTLIFGASDTKGTLLIEQGGKIIADGSANSPIVFTSEKPIGNRVPGDWGGIVICGKAPVNQGNLITLEGNYGATYGGNDDNDNSGILRYVRIEFAGKIISNNQEINSLTLAGVGRGTTIENVMCSFGLDDSFEFFGGNVNAKRLISFNTKDDDFDFDFGYSGFIQFAIAIRGADYADASYSNGLEVDNDGAGTQMSPLTQPVLANFTIIGGKYDAAIEANPLIQNGAHFRRNSMPTIYNSFITGFPVGIFIDDTKPGASQHALDDELQARNIVLAGIQNWGNNNWGGSPQNQYGPLRQGGSVAQGFEINNWYSSQSYNNSILTKWQDAGIDESIFASNNPVLMPLPGSILLSSGKWDNTPKATDSFFEKTGINYVGAIGQSNWTTGWATFDPQSTVY